MFGEVVSGLVEKVMSEGVSLLGGQCVLRYQLKSASLSCYFVTCGSDYSCDLCRVTSYSEE